MCKRTRWVSMVLPWLCSALVTGRVLAADERVLRLDNGKNPPVQLSVATLLKQQQPLTLAIDDIEYRATHRYEGVDLRQLLKQTGFEAGAQLLLVCTDGYSIPFDSSVLADAQWLGLLAVRDMDAPVGKDFIDFKHGAEWVNFAPFYLVWTQAEVSATASAKVALRDLPWPYQLTEIRALKPTDYQAAMPSASASVLVKDGFSVYFKHCIKCHSVNASGGTLGPALDAAHGLSTLLQRGDLRERIQSISKFFPGSKMPTFAGLLSATEVDALVAYLTEVQQAQ
jgi:mono/diheme cytochrome c family protein